MRYYADLHIHSKYSRACSRDCDIEHLTWWARRKGITVVGTGDFTHPAWFAHLREVLEPAEPGLFRLRGDLERDVGRSLPGSCSGDVRFMLSVEISTIYKHGERTRKVHHLCYVPDFAAAEEFNRRLGRIGNLGSDGRPILGLDSRDLLEITLECGEGAYLVPAHIWTPWFAVLGSKAGFDSVEECYRDLSGHVFALETGLSSDPAMNWRVSSLDGYTLVSHSDAHSPPMLGREASVFDTAVDYFAMKGALRSGVGYEGSVEFFPEEGKYHLDGHRRCGVRLDPPRTRELGGRCPRCGGVLTVGVSHRVAALADRPVGARPAGAAGFRNLIPLPEIVGEVAGVGPKSKRVRSRVEALTAAHGPELRILEDVPVEELRRSDAVVAEAVARLRAGEVVREAGYDGEYGTIRVFGPGEVARLRAPGAEALFDEESLGVAVGRSPGAEGSTAESAGGGPVGPVGFDGPVASGGGVAAPESEGSDGGGVLDGLDPDQRAAAEVGAGPLLVVAGPGTGKTSTVTRRIASLVVERGVAAGECLAITFTRRAAEEMSQRLRALMGARASEVTVATFHSLGLWLVREFPERVGLAVDFGVADAAVQHQVLVEVAGGERAARRVRGPVSRVRRGGGGVDAGVAELARVYTEGLRARGLVDYDDLVVLAVELLGDAWVREWCRRRFRWVTVDEYQDVDELQYRLLRLLAPEGSNLAVIGDPDQAIYAFRGADVRFFLRFREDYPGAREVRLRRNYRSGRHIVAGAVRAVAPSTLVAGRELRAVRGGRAHRVAVHAAADERAEAAFVARTIEGLLGGASFHALDSGRVADDGDGCLGFGDVAVLCRTQARSRAVVEELDRCGLPVQKRSHDPLSARAGVRRLVGELVAAGAGGDGGSVVGRLRGAARSVVEGAPQGAHEEVAGEVHAAVELLTPLAGRFGADVAGFVREVSLGAEVDALDPRAEAVSLLTLHAAKGLEFPVVFVVGCEDGVLPLRWGGEVPDEAALAEERRLFFVGMTRARDRLYLTRAARREGSGGVRETRASPFLGALGGAVMVEESASTRRRGRATQLSLM